MMILSTLIQSKDKVKQIIKKSGKKNFSLVLIFAFELMILISIKNTVLLSLNVVEKSTKNFQGKKIA